MTIDTAEAEDIPPTPQEIESVCDRFEAAWQRQRRPHIAEYWRDRDGAQLLRELLVLDLVYRARYRDHPHPREYHDRFPAHADAIHSAFKSAGMNSSSSHPPPAPSVAAGMLGSCERPPFATPSAPGLRFRVLRPLAKGGLGEVFVARDEELRREVALKLIQEQFAGDTDSHNRFLFEAEITGRLEHPGVIPVYGLGVDEKGRPYYAMRFIRGESLKESIARFHRADGPTPEPGERSLALRELLRRFIDVCNTIAYAHGRGVLHRDLKPANVMLGDFGETLVVDWGLAKIAGRPDGDSHAEDGFFNPEFRSGTNSTKQGSWLGTPSFMSPEQAAGRIDLLGPASDVYSLGATLFNLLTGKSAFDGTDVTTVLSQVQQGAFPSPRSLEPRIDRALEAVCLKAMANQPENRYASCRALADDVERWAADEPVSAWREPAGRRVRRWAKQNRTMVTAAAVAMLASFVGLAAVLVVQTRAKADLALSLSRELKANTSLAEANLELERSKDAVQARYDLAVKAVRTFHTGVSEDFLLKEDQFKELRDRLLNSASEFYGELGALLGKESDQASRRALAQAEFDVAELTAKVGRREVALQTHRKVLTSRQLLAASLKAAPLWEELNVDIGRSLMSIAILLQELGKTEEALTMYRNAEGLLIRTVASIPVRATARAALAECRARLGVLLFSTGKSDDALSILGQARDDQALLASAAGATHLYRNDLANTISSIGSVLMDTGKAPEAEAALRAAIAIHQGLADEKPAMTNFRSSLAHSHRMLANALGSSGKLVQAEAQSRESLAVTQKLADDYPGVAGFRSLLAASHSSLGTLLSKSGKSADAAAEQRRALKIVQKLADEYPAVTNFQTQLATSHSGLANVLFVIGKPLEAEAAYREALNIHQRLADSDPTVTGYRESLADDRFMLGHVLLFTGKSPEAEREFAKSLVIRKKMADDHPAFTRFRYGLALSLNMIGDRLVDAGKFKEAVPRVRDALAIRRKLVDDNPTNTNYRFDLAASHYNLALALTKLNDPAEAESEFRQALALQQKLTEDSPTDTRFRKQLAITHIDLGWLLSTRGMTREAEAEYHKSMPILERLTADNPQVTDYWIQLAQAHADLGSINSGAGNRAAAESEFREALEIRQKLAVENPSVPGYRREMTRSYNILGEMLVDVGRNSEAIDVLVRSCSVLETLITQYPSRSEYRTGLALSLSLRGRAHWRAGELAPAANDLRRAVALREAMATLTPGTRYDLARNHAVLAGLAGTPGSAVSPSEAADEADRAVTELKRALSQGFRDLSMDADPSFDPIRNRPDFRSIMLDVQFPVDPFSNSRRTK